jgi:hypothetical protein
MGRIELKPRRVRVEARPAGGGMAVPIVAACAAVAIAAVAVLVVKSTGDRPVVAREPAAPAVLPALPVKPTEPKPLPPEADAVYALQDRQNAAALWALVEDLRGNAAAVKTLHVEMRRDAEAMEAKVRAASAEGKSIPLGQRLLPEDELTSVNGLQVWSNNLKPQDAAKSLAVILRATKEGERLTVRFRRGGNPVEFVIEFHGKQEWPVK